MYFLYAFAKGCDFFLSDFNIQVGATLEQGASSKLQQDLKNMKNLSIEIQSAKLADSAVSGIKNQLESALKGITINFGNLGGQAQQASQNIGKQISTGINRQLSNIQFKIDTQGYTKEIANIQAKYEKFGVSIEETKEKIESLKQAYNKIFNASTPDKRLEAEKEYRLALQKTRNELSILSSKTVSIDKRTNLSNSIQKWLLNNTKATQEARIELQGYIEELKKADLSGTEFDSISTRFKDIDNLMRAQGKLGRSFSDTFKNAVSKFSEWGLASSAVMSLVNNIRSSITELKNVDTLLTEISKANDKLSSADLKQIGSEAFDIASNYGKKASDYLSGVQDASRAGYENAKAIAELSTAVQGAGDMTADLANQYIISTDKAYQFNGSIEKLTEVLDGSNYITNNYATTMTDLAEGMSIVGSTAASFGVDVDEATAALATMSATTQQSGSEVARAFRAILLNIRQVSDEEEGIDAEGLTKYEEACNALGVSLKETKNGILSLRDPMEVLKELSVTYNQLSESDIRRTNLLSSVGGKLRSTQLDALLRNWSTYEQMLQTYSEGTGSMAREAEKTANSWEGSMNRLSNTWTDTVGNIANSDVIIGTINTLNALLSVVNSLTESLGGIGSIGLGIGLFAGIKNIGRGKMYPLD